MVQEKAFRNLKKNSGRCFHNGPLFVSVDSFGSLPASQDSSASSIVATPHWGDCSFSDDLTSDGISATGCPQRFAHWATVSLAPPGHTLALRFVCGWLESGAGGFSDADVKERKDFNPMPEGE